MEISTRIVGIRLTDENQRHIDTKCSGFGKRFKNAVSLTLEIRKDRHHRKGDVIGMRASVTMRAKESVIVHAESAESTFIRALDEVLDALSRQLERSKAAVKKRATANKL